MSVSGVEAPLSAVKRRRFWATSLSVAAVTLAGCAPPPTPQHYAHGHEHFAQAKYGHASPKVVADGQPVPRGGGQYLLGRPYTVAGHRYYPNENPSYSAVGMASWYGAAFHGRRTANGEVYDMASLSAAHPTMPLPSYARVTNLSNGYSIIVRVNDRGPYSGGRVMDVSSRVAEVLDFKSIGTARVKVEYVGQAPMEGSDDSQLLASLRTDGSPASLIGYPGPVMVAGNFETQHETIFSWLGGRGGEAQPQPAAEPPAPAPAEVASRKPRPQREPIEVAAAAPPPAAEPESPPPEPPAPPAPIPVRQPAVAAPLPPARPFDLGANRSPALVVAAVSQPQRVAMPPRRPELHASAEKALYFSDVAVPRLRGAALQAFERVKAMKSDPSED